MLISRFLTTNKKVIAQLSSMPLPEVTKNVVALTGSIGSGKSTAAAMLKQLGACVVSADDLAREATAPGGAALGQIKNCFGEHILDADGKLRRELLAEIVFNCAEKRQLLEKIVHPVVAQLAQTRLERALSEGHALVVYDVPLFFEAGLAEEQWRAVVVISALDEVCVKRVVARDNTSPEEVRRRIAAQLPLRDKEAKADVVVDNSGTPDELRKEMELLYRMFAGTDCRSPSSRH